MSEENNTIEDVQEVQASVPGISPYYKTIDDTKQVQALVHAEDDGSFSVFKRPALEQQPQHIVLQNLQEVQGALAGQLVPSTPTEFEDMLVNQWGYSPADLRDAIPTNTAQEEAERNAIDANNAENNLVQADDEGAIVPESLDGDALDVGSDGDIDADQAILDEKLDELADAYGADDFDILPPTPDSVDGENLIVLFKDGKEIAQGTLSELEDKAPKTIDATAEESASSAN